MKAKASLISAAVAGFSAVALGAFGAHGLKTILSPALMAAWQTAVQYHLVHSTVLLLLALALLSNGLPAATRIWLQRSANMMLAGILLFSGSLYLMALTGIRPLGMITPLGGVSWLVAWGLIVMAAIKLPDPNSER